jgi:hypothetical protein
LKVLLVQFKLLPKKLLPLDFPALVPESVFVPAAQSSANAGRGATKLSVAANATTLTLVNNDFATIWRDTNIILVSPLRKTFRDEAS